MKKWLLVLLLLASSSFADYCPVGTLGGGGGTWGSITGTLSSQTDLQSALDAKVTGPASATSDAVALFSGTTGKIIKNSLLKLTSGVLIYNGQNFADIVNRKFFNDLSVLRVDLNQSWLTLHNSAGGDTPTVKWGDGDQLLVSYTSGGTPFTRFDWRQGLLNDDTTTLSADVQSRHLNDSGNKISYQWQNREWYDTNSVATAAHTTLLTARYGDNADNTFGNVSTKIDTDSDTVGTTNTGTDEQLYSFTPSERSLRSSPSGDSLHFDCHGDSDTTPGGNGQIIKMEYGGVQLGSDFQVTNFDPWSVKGYLFYDNNSGTVRFYEMFGNGRDFHEYNGDTGISDPTNPVAIALIGNDGTGTAIYKRYCSVIWEGGGHY